MYYLIRETLTECESWKDRQNDEKFVAVLTPAQWQKQRSDYDINLDFDFDAEEIHTTMAEVNHISVTGTFAIPYGEHRADLRKFAFVLNEDAIEFIDSGNTANEIINRIRQTRRWRTPSLERFIYDFLEEIIAGDLSLLEEYERKLADIDKDINEKKEADLKPVNEIRDHLRLLKTHYDRLIDLAQELEENENDFFSEENLRFFSLFSKRAGRLFDTTAALLDYTSQIRDDYEALIADRQNNIMTILTVVTTVFMPLTLIAGWYGMNFRYMPELNSVYGYPVVIMISILIAVVSLLYFRHKKWL